MTANECLAMAVEMRRRADKTVDPDLQHEWLNLAQEFEFLAAAIAGRRKRT